MKHALRPVSVSVIAAAIALGPVRVALAHPSIDIVAANWKFTPSTIELHVGEATTLRLTSSGGVHGIKSDDLKIPETTITPGAFSTVTVTPAKAGTYVIHCSIVCGAGHPNMTLTANVVK